MFASFMEPFHSFKVGLFKAFLSERTRKDVKVYGTFINYVVCIEEAKEILRFFLRNNRVFYRINLKRLACIQNFFQDSQ